jgi:uncharacterized damage-inducible protein DinB
MIRPPLPDPPSSAQEKVMLSAFLDWARDALLRKVEGLDREALTRRLVVSDTTLLSVVKHLACVERRWFRMRFNGERLVDDRDSDFVILQSETGSDVISRYQYEVAQSRAIVDRSSLEDRARDVDWQGFTLRWIMLHMVEETARHVGHVDILREQIDGARGK